MRKKYATCEECKTESPDAKKNPTKPLDKKTKKPKTKQRHSQGTITDIRESIENCASLIEFLQNNFDNKKREIDNNKTTPTRLKKTLELADVLAQYILGETNVHMRPPNRIRRVCPNSCLECTSCAMCDFETAKTSVQRPDKEKNVRLPLTIPKGQQTTLTHDSPSKTIVQKSYKKRENKKEDLKKTPKVVAQTNSVQSITKRKLRKRKRTGFFSKSISSSVTSVSKSVTDDVDYSLKKLDRIVEDFKENVSSVILKKKTSAQPSTKSSIVSIKKKKIKSHNAKGNFTLKSFIPIYNKYKGKNAEHVVAIQMTSSHDYKNYLGDLVHTNHHQSSTKLSKKQSTQKKPKKKDDVQKDKSKKERKHPTKSPSTDSNKFDTTDISMDLVLDPPSSSNREHSAKEVETISSPSSNAKKKFKSKSEEKIQNVEFPKKETQHSEKSTQKSKAEPSFGEKQKKPKSSKSHGIISKLIDKKDEILEKTRKSRSVERKAKKKSKKESVSPKGDSNQNSSLIKETLSNDILKSTKYDVTIEKFVEFAKSQLNDIDSKNQTISTTTLKIKEVADKSMQTEFEIFVMDFPSGPKVENLLKKDDGRNEKEAASNNLRSKNEEYVLAVQKGMDVARKSITEFFTLVQRMDNQFSNHVLTKLAVRTNSDIKMLADGNKDTCALTYTDEEEKKLHKTKSDKIHYEMLKDKKVDKILMKNFCKVEHCLNMVMHYYKMIVETKSSLDKLIDKRFFDPSCDTKEKLSTRPNSNPIENTASSLHADLKRSKQKCGPIPKRKSIRTLIAHRTRRPYVNSFTRNNPKVMINIADPRLERSQFHLTISLGLQIATLRMTQCPCKSDTSLREDTFAKIKPVFDEDDEYHEQYLESLIHEISLEPYVNPCGSTPSLPAIQVETDRCEDRMEIPWMQISLPPPGTLHIKSTRIITKKSPCTCWRTKEDVIETELPTASIQVPGEICKCTETDETLEKSGFPKPDHFDDKPIVTEPIERKVIDTKLADEEQSKQGESKQDETEPDGTQQDDTKPDETNQDETKPDETVPEEIQSEEIKPEEAAPRNATPVQGTDDDDQSEPLKADVKTALDELEETLKNAPEAEGEHNLIPWTQKKKPREISEEKQKETQLAQKTGREICTCPDKVDDICKDIKNLPMIYDDPCYAGHEPYMDGLYHLFPDDCDTPCGPYTEIPWSDLLIPRNIKLKGAIRKKKTCRSGSSDGRGCGRSRFDDPNDPNSMALVKVDKNEMVKCDKATEKFDVEITFTEVMNQLDKSCKNRKKPPPPSELKKQICACFEKAKRKSPVQQSKATCRKSSSRQRQKPSKSKKSRKEEIIAALDSCQAEMVPIRDALNDLKSKIKALRQNRAPQPPETKQIGCGNSKPSCVPSPLGPPVPIPIPMTGCPFLPPPSTICPLPLMPPLAPPPLQVQFTSPIDVSKVCNQTSAPRARHCQKCRRRKAAKKEANNTSTTSDYETYRKKPCGHGKERSMKKACRCKNKIAEKMTNTRRPNCKSGKCGHQPKVRPPSPAVTERPQSGRSVTSGGRVIIEECDF